MRIDEYYRNAAKANINGSLLALLPAIMIIGANLAVFHHRVLMLLTIPFLIYSIVSFQSCLLKKKQAMMVEKNLPKSDQGGQWMLSANKLLVFFENTMVKRLILYFPDGRPAGELKREGMRRTGFFNMKKVYILTDPNKNVIGQYQIIEKKRLKIAVFDHSQKYIGCLERTRNHHILQCKKELLDETGRFIAAVEGAGYYMDEQVIDAKNRTVARLQRGFLPLEWSGYFPEANTPVLSLSQNLSENEKIVHMAVLINEFFIER